MLTLLIKCICFHFQELLRYMWNHTHMLYTSSDLWITQITSSHLGILEPNRFSSSHSYTSIYRKRGGAAWLRCNKSTVGDTEERFYSTIWIINWTSLSSPPLSSSLPFYSLIGLIHKLNTVFIYVALSYTFENKGSKRGFVDRWADTTNDTILYCLQGKNCLLQKFHSLFVLMFKSEVLNRGSANVC